MLFYMYIILCVSVEKFLYVKRYIFQLKYASTEGLRSATYMIEYLSNLL